VLQVGVYVALALVVGVPGVVHQDIEPTELLLDKGREPIHALLVGHVAGEPFGGDPAALLSREPRITVIPLAASRRQISNPIPLFPPLTSATRPFSVMKPPGSRCGARKILRSE
jgi:hypothetical protein